MTASSIRVLTLNCWGLKYVSKDRVERISAIASAISRSSYDFVALQELWVSSDYECVRAALEKRLPYAKYFFSGALGAGLAIFSRFPISTASIHPYSLNGHPVDVIGGDWMVGKAAGSVLIHHSILGEVEIFNTHLFAKGGEIGPEHLRAHRLVNAWEFAKLVRTSASLGRYVIAAGDFNSIPTTLPMKIIRDHAGVLDAWVESHTATDLNDASLSPEDAIKRYGVTADNLLNTYSAGKPLDVTARRHFGKRLDYIFYREPVDKFLAEKPVLKCTQSQVVFTERVPNQSFSYSDHFGLEATIEIVPPIAREASALREPLNRRLSPLLDDVLGTFVHALTTCYRNSQDRSRFELTTFATCIVFLIALCIGSAWLPHPWISPIFILFTILLSWLGTTMLYAGFIYGNWERRALMNVIEELELIRRSNARQSEPETVSPTPSVDRNL